MAGLNKGVPSPTETKLHQISDGHNTGIYSWDLLYDYGMRQDEMWRHYLKRMQEADASREPKEVSSKQ